MRKKIISARKFIKPSFSYLVEKKRDGGEFSDEEIRYIVDSILDWRDENDLHRINGAENAYYQALSDPYDCKNGDFDAIEELLMVRGITPDIFYGGLKDRVTALQDRGSKRGEAARISRKAGGDKICINAASKSMLLSLPQMTNELAQSIIDFRKEADFKNVGEISTLLGADIYGAISSYISLTPSPYYQIFSLGEIDDSRTRQALLVAVEINSSIKKGYRVVEWNDRAALIEGPSPESKE